MQEDARWRIMTSHDRHAALLTYAGQCRRSAARRYDEIGRALTLAEAHRAIRNARTFRLECEKWRRGVLP